MARPDNNEEPTVVTNSTAAEIAALRATLQAHMHLQARDREEAKTQREQMAQEIKTIEHLAREALDKVTAMDKIVADTKRITDQVKGWRTMVAGAGLFVTLLWGLYAASVTDAGMRLWAALRRVYTGD